MKTALLHVDCKQRQRGLSLIELMIAMTIGLVIIGAVGSLFLTTRQASRTTESMSRMQEGARYALQALARDVRMAGYVGCGNLENIPMNAIANPPGPGLTFATAITGNDEGAGPSTIGTIARPAGDAIIIGGAFGGGVFLDGNMGVANANIQLACDPTCNPYNFVPDEVLLITDCVSSDEFRANNVSNSGTITTIAHSSAVNTTNFLSRAYGPDAFVIRPQQYTYFIGTNPAGKRSLYRNVSNAVPVTVAPAPPATELVEDVWNMQVQFGVDTNDDDAADDYINPAAVTNWTQVVSTRISLVMVSPENGITTSAQTYTLNGAAVTATDRRMYQVFTTTVGIRNRLP